MTKTKDQDINKREFKRHYQTSRNSYKHVNKFRCYHKIKESPKEF